MKLTVTLLLFLITLGCNKEEIAKTAVISAMTNGQWKVVDFHDGATDLISDFQGYEFKFNTNFTVNAVKNGTVENTGTWNADADARTITSTFSSASEALTLLNGTWKISDNSWSFVEANLTVNGSLRKLRLEKL